MDYVLDGENKWFKLLSDLEYEKHDVLHSIIVLESKLISSEKSVERIDRFKNSVSLS